MNIKPLEVIMAVAFILLIAVGNRDYQEKQQKQREQEIKLSLQQQKWTIEAACSEMMATRKFESARRVKVLNEARMKLNKGPYSMSHEFIDHALTFGDCESLF